MVAKTSIHGQWSSRWAFILAVTGSAVGLGNIWRFPYLVGENGGAMFVLIYLLCVLLVGLPIIMAEIILGRRGRQNLVHTMQGIAADEGLSRHWGLIGWMGIAAGFIILSYYSVIAGWTLAYFFRVASGTFSSADGGLTKQIFTELITDPERLMAWHTIFMIATVVVIAQGVKNGLEPAVKTLMPLLFILLLIMVGYATTTGNFIAGARYLFVPDFASIADKNFLNDMLLPALGQAFFSLSIGMGAIMIYGSYLSKEASITFSCCAIVVADTLVALLAGLVIFPLVFTYGLEPSGGPGLIFITLPIAFGQMPLGAAFGSLFFLLLLFAAWTSAISLLEPAVTWFIEKRNMTRAKAAIICGVIAWLLGIVTVLSFNHWAFSFKFAGVVKENGLFDVLDILTANIMLPLGGLLIAIFTGWLMARKSSVEELNIGDGKVYKCWYFATRFIAPSGVIIIFLNAVGIL